MRTERWSDSWIRVREWVRKREERGNPVPPWPCVTQPTNPDDPDEPVSSNPTEPGLAGSEAGNADGTGGDFRWTDRASGGPMEPDTQQPSNTRPSSRWSSPDPQPCGLTQPIRAGHDPVLRDPLNSWTMDSSPSNPVAIQPSPNLVGPSTLRTHDTMGWLQPRPLSPTRPQTVTQTVTRLRRLFRRLFRWPSGEFPAESVAFSGEFATKKSLG
jgi:hypothetical protein